MGLSLLLLLPIAYSATPEEPQSIFWEPYRYDGSTVCLYHFDEEETGTFEAGLDAPESGKAGAPDGELLGGEKGDDRGAANAVMSGKKADLLGACRRVPGQGRFGGGLHMEGTDGRIVGELPGGARTLEFWVRPEKPAAGASTITHVSAARSPQTIQLRLTREGALELDWMGQVATVPGYQFRDGQWTHVALAWDGRERSEFRLDGKAVSFEKPLAFAGTEKLTRCVVGNDFAGKNGFRGVIDEVRLSSAIRQYYPRTFGWIRTAESRKIEQGRPYFRDTQDLLFHVNYDRTVAAAKAPEDATAPEEVVETRKRLTFLDPERPRPPFDEGIDQQAVVVGKDGAVLEYRGPGLLLPERGSIALWIRPLNWNNHVTWNPFAPYAMKTVPIFAVVAGGKDQVAHLTLMQTPDADSWQYPVDIHPGRWLHICLTWEKGRLTTYLDGNPWPYWGAWSWNVKAWDTKKELALRFGRDESLCALDDFRIYRRALAPSEVANLAALFDCRKELRPLPPMEMTFDYNGVLGRVDVQLYPLSPDYGKVDNAQVTVTAKGESAPLGQQNLRFDGCPETRGRVNTPPLDFGVFQVKALARDAEGRAVCEAMAEFERKAPPWWGNRLGVTDKVMPGWTPVTVKDEGGRMKDEGAVIGVILRDIHLSVSGLPRKIVSVGEDILAGPVELTATAGGKTEALAPLAGVFRAETRGEVRADFSGQAAAAGLKAAIQGYIEFDGMMWFQVTLNPIDRQPSTIDRLGLTIPYTEDASRLLHWWSGNHGFRDPRVVHIGATPPGEGDVFSCLDKARVALYGNLRGSFMPYVMLTGDKRGMAWFAENDQGWTQSREIPAVLIRREGHTVTLILNIISETVRIDGPRAFEFGLHPIPVKELEPGWRMTPNWGVYPDSFCGFNMKGPQPTQFYRHPENMDWEMAQSRAQRAWTFNVASFRRLYGRDPKPREISVPGLYHDLSGIAAFPDHTREWGGEVWWTRRYTSEMTDYCAWIWNEWVRRGLAKGIYYDNCFNYPLDSWPTPVTYKLPDGKVQPGFQWRQIREHLKRTRQISHDHGLVPHLCTHTTHTYFIPYHSFFDTILDGEDFYQNPGEKRDFMDSWRPDRLRFNNSEKWGLISTWLGWHAGGDGGKWGKFQTLYWQHWRAYTAALMVHDLVWTVGMSGPPPPEVDAEWLRASKLCLDPDTRFVGYWDLATPAAHSHRNLYVSAWKRPGWCALTLVNWSRERIEAEVRLDPKAMGFGDTAANEVDIKDVDTSLLRYFDGDLTRMKAPDAEKADETALLDTPDKTKAGGFEAGTGKEEDDLDALGFKKKVTIDVRKANDPDGKFEWKDGVLKCPVRPHDFRLFEFRLR